MKDDVEADDDDLPITGDAIGDTAYSERFVLGALIKLSQPQPPTEEFIEGDLCALWDMTGERDVAAFASANGASRVFASALANSSNARLTEIVVGCAANVRCHVTADEEEDHAPLDDVVLSFISSDDPLILVQVLRFVFSTFYRTQSTEPHLERLRDSNFPASLAFLMRNSLHEAALLNAFETLNCICSRASSSPLFQRLFLTKELIGSTVIAHDQLSQILTDADKIQRFHYVFLAMHSILANLIAEESDLYRDVSIVRCLHRIVSAQDDATSECLEYVVSVLSCLKFPTTEDTMGIFCKFVDVWKEAVVDGEGDSFEDCEERERLAEVCVQFFARAFKLWPLETLKGALKRIDNRYVERMRSDVGAMLKSEKLSSYYGDVEDVIQSIVDSPS